MEFLPVFTVEQRSYVEGEVLVRGPSTVLELLDSAER